MESLETATPVKLSIFRKLVAWYLKDPILVYTMGKVGSSSVINTLINLGIHAVQPHSLTLSRRGSYFVLPKRTQVNKLKDKFKSHLLRLKGKCFFLLKRLTGTEVKVLTLTRDPLSRTISAYFEQYQYVQPYDIDMLETQALIDNFFEFANHNTPHEWFDNEIKPMLGVDVYSLDFDKTKGWHRVQTKAYDVLIMKMESMPFLEDVMAGFFNIEEFSLRPTNRAQFKAYSGAYDRFKKEIRFTDEYLDFHYNSQYANHFYTKDELTYFREKWT